MLHPTGAAPAVPRMGESERSLSASATTVAAEHGPDEATPAAAAPVGIALPGLAADKVCRRKLLRECLTCALFACVHSWLI